MVGMIQIILGDFRIIMPFHQKLEKAMLHCNVDIFSQTLCIAFFPLWFQGNLYSTSVEIS